MDKGQYEKFGIEQKKMLRIGAVDCADFGALCDKEGITEYPTYRVYPPFPAPTQDHTSGDKEVDTDVLKKMCFRHIGNRVIDITSANHDVFKTDNPGKPKVLLFTDKAKTPIVYRALSTYFDVSYALQSCWRDNFQIFTEKFLLTRFQLLRKLLSSAWSKKRRTRS